MAPNEQRDTWASPKKMWSRLEQGRMMIARMVCGGRPFVFLGLCVGVFHVALGGCITSQTTRQQRGQTHSHIGPLPIWQPLTTYEKETIQQAKAPKPSSRTLLRLALLFSGVRTATQAAPYVTIYQRTLARLRGQMKRYNNPHDKGKALLKLMHTQLLGSQLNPQNTKYQLNQTRIDVLLKEGSFNCLSSSIVFGLLAQDLGFQVELALMPTHVFVQLKHPKTQRTYPVETTSPLGFNHKYNRDYYEGEQKKWALSRGLTPATYEDFLNRTIHDLRHVICRMALWKHLLRVFPDLNSQRRMREVAGHLDRYIKLQENRLATWINTYQGLRKQNDATRARQLFGKIGPALMSLQEGHKGSAKLQSHLGLLHLYWLEVALAASPTTPLYQGRRERYQAFAAIYKALKMRPAGLQQHLHWLLSDTLDRLARQGKKAQGQRWLQRAAQLNAPRQRDYKVLFWNHLGNRLLRKRKWAPAIDAYRQCVKQTQPRGDETCQKNLRAARYNWAATAQHQATQHAGKQQWEQAIAAFKRCLQRTPAGTPLTRYCQQGMAAVYYNWSLHYVQQQKTPQARRLLQQCTAIQPPLPACQNLLQQLN